MNIDTLIRQANRIGAFFEAQPDRNEALDDVAGHIEKFWEPRMRRAMLDFLESCPEGKTPNIALTDFAREAIMRSAARLKPTLQTT